MSWLTKIFGKGYDAGESTRLRRDLGWARAQPSDEDSLVANDRTRELARQKAFDLFRNNGVVGGACERIAFFCLGGTGIAPQCRTSDGGWNRAAEQWWATQYEPSCDTRGRVSLYELQTMAISMRPTHGGLYVQLLEDGTVMPIECERIRQPAKSELAKSYVDGVRLKNGRVLGYRVHNRDASGGFGMDSDGVDIEASSVLPVIRPPWRPDQVREIPDLARVVPHFQDLSEMNLWTLNTAKAQSGMLGFLKRIAGSGLPGPRGATNPTVGQRQTFKFDWGQVLEGFLGEDLEMKVSPTPNGQHIPYMKLQLALCAAGLNFPYEFLTLDLSNLDFSRQKGLLLLVNHACRPWKSWLVKRFLHPLWCWRVALEMAPGRELSPAPADVKGRSEWDKVQWQPPEEPWIDRQEAQQSDVLEVQAGLSTLSEACSRRGKDLEDTLRRKAADWQLVEKISAETGVPEEKLVKMQIPGQTEPPKPQKPEEKPPAKEPPNGNP